MGEDGCDTQESTLHSAFRPIWQWARPNDSNFDIRYFLSIQGSRVSRKKDPKSQNDGEFFQQKGPFLDKIAADSQNDSEFDIRSSKR